METKDLMGDSFKSKCARELCISLLQPASSVPGEGTLKATVSEDLVVTSASLGSSAAAAVWSARLSILSHSLQAHLFGYTLQAGDRTLHDTGTL